jgi:hypothetical protein
MNRRNGDRSMQHGWVLCVRLDGFRPVVENADRVDQAAKRRSLMARVIRGQLPTRGAQRTGDRFAAILLLRFSGLRSRRGECGCGGGAE